MASDTPGPPPAQHDPFDRKRRYRRGGGSFFWPLLLIVVGLIFLLQNFGVLSWNAWGSLWRLWPLILVVVGLELIFRDRLGGGLGLLLAVVVIAAAAIALLAGEGSFSQLGPVGGPASAATSYSHSQPLQGAQQAHVTVNFGAGDLSLGALEPGSSQLSAITYDGPADLQPTPRFSVNGGVAQLTYSTDDHRWRGFPFNGGGTPNEQLMLNPDVPLALTVQGGASSSHIDLSKLKVTNLSLQTGASTTWLRLPETAGSTQARIEGGASTLTVQIPQGVAAQIRYHGGLSSVTVDSARFPTVDSSGGATTYRSADYGSASNKVDLDIQTGVSTVTIQ